MQKKEKHVPMRTCIVTREKKPKKELMRIVRVDGKAKVDPDGKERGRGANISMDEELFSQALQKGILRRALKLKDKITKEEKEKLKEEFKKAIEKKKFRQGRKAVTLRVTREGEKKKVE